MAKVALTDLLKPAPAPEAAPSPEGAPPAPTTPPVEPAGESIGDAAPSGRRAAREPVARTSRPRTRGAAAGPKYLRLERKETRIRADQLDALTSLQRRLNKARRGEGERITENTLTRVAIDLLLARAEELEGVDEDELRKSVGL